MAVIQFADFTPDVPKLGSSGVIKNAIPHIKSYKKFPSLTAYSNALTAYVRGAYADVDSDGNASLYCGDATKLYRLVGATMTDSSKTGGYSCSSDAYWEFAKFGDQCIATNFDNNIQTITMGGTQFADLAGSPPKARHIGVVGRFVVVGNTFDDSDGNVPNRIRWSGFDDETLWTVSATTQADYQDLKNTGGWVQRIIGGERGIVFQERAISIMTYIGSPIVFQVDTVEEARGALAPGGVIKVGNISYFISDDGFYAFSAGQSFPIGADKVDKYFLADVDESYLHRITAAAIPKDKVIIWSYPGADSSDGTPSDCLLYNWASKKWCYAKFNHELIFRAMSVGVTLDGLDSLYASIDSVPFSLDSRVWMGGTLQLGGFDTSHKLGFFTGSALSAIFETGESQIASGKRAEVFEVNPLVDGGTHTVQIGTRERQADTISWSSAYSENSSGICPTRVNSRFHSFRVNVSGEFTDAVGVDVTNYKLVGER